MIAFHRARMAAGIVLAIALIFVLLFARATMTPKPTNSIIDLSGMKFEISDTSESRRQGLSGRDSLKPYVGMLFIFGSRGIYPFWMKDMKFPLDIVWLDRGVVVDMVTLQHPNEGSAPAAHVPVHLSDMVLELPAGGADDLGIRKGAYVILPWN